jgi:diacylglycerol O-acyltransferase
VARLYYERLSGESARYLDLEQSRRRAHVTVIAIFEAGPLATPEGGVQFERIRQVVSARLSELPRLRRKLRRVPFDGHPVWVDDPEFHLDGHLQQSSLPHPGSMDQLCRTTARIAAARLDRSRPLWDCWILEGLSDGRFALVLKMHKALANLEGADLLKAILSTDSDPISTAASSYHPRPAPSPVELFTEEVLKRWSPSRRILDEGVRLIRRPGRALREAQNQAKSLLQVLGYKLRPTGESPFDGILGPHRSFAVQSVDLGVIQSMRRSWGGSVHDSVLSIVSGTLRRFMIDRYMNPVSVDLRAITPILDRSGASAHPWNLELPLWEERPAERHGLIRDQTRRIGIEKDVATGDSMTDGSEWNASRLFAIGARAVKTVETGHVTVLQAPGPKQSLYLDGAELTECYGILPLQDCSGLGITVLSYAGKLYFAFNADSNLVPDVPRLREALNAEVSDIRAAVAESGPALRAVGGRSR